MTSPAPTSEAAKRIDGACTSADEHDALRWFRAHELVNLRLAHPTYARGLPAVIRAAQHG